MSISIAHFFLMPGNNNDTVVHKNIHKFMDTGTLHAQDGNTVIKYEWDHIIPFLEQLSAEESILIMIWDKDLNRILYAVDNNNIMGHSGSFYTATDGMKFLHSYAHADYVTPILLMCEKGKKFIKTHNNIERKKIIINFDGKCKNEFGNYIHFLQQTVCIETDNSNNPVNFLTYIHDITHIKKERTANLIITTHGSVNMWNYNFNSRMLDMEHSLTFQEKKILASLAQGKHSKDIAASLCISVNTVDTHRRNLLKKLNCMDTTGLITYARLTCLL